MATIITREVGATAKGTPLTNAELDNNFVNLNSELATKANTNNPTFTGTVVAPALSIPTNTAPAVFIKDDNLTAWDYSGKSFSVNAQETNPAGIFFKPDGLAMYVTGSTGDDVTQYSLSVAWDVTTATFVQVSVAVGETGPGGVFFKPDGLAMYVIGSTNDSVREFSLSVAWDVSTITFVRDFSVAAEETGPADVWFKPDGTKMYVVGTSGDDINEYNLSTAWNVSTAVFVQSFSVAAQDTAPVAVVFNPDGTKMYVLGSTGQDINRYTLSTAWNVSTAVFFNNFYVGFQEITPNGLFIDFDSNTAYVVGTTTDTVYQYSTLTDGIELVSESGLFVQGSLYTNKNLLVTGGTRVDGTLSVSGAATLASTLSVGSTATFSAAVTMTTTTSSITIGTSQTSGALTIGGTAQTGAITLGRSTGAQTINIGTGVNTASTKTINIGTGGTTGTTEITIGNTLGTTNLTLPIQAKLSDGVVLDQGWDAASTVLKFSSYSAVGTAPGISSGEIFLMQNLSWNGVSYEQTDGTSVSTYLRVGGNQVQLYEAYATGVNNAELDSLNAPEFALPTVSFGGGGITLQDYNGGNQSITAGNGGRLRVYDTNFMISDSVTTTKSFDFNCANITDATIRTLTIPDASGTIALTDGTQTFSGSTFFAENIADGVIPTVFKAGRETSQYTSFYGNSGGNRLISVSSSTNAKDFAIRVTDTVLTGIFGFSRTGLLSATSFSGALNGTVGATTPSTGAFTTLTTSGSAVISVADNTNAALRITQTGTGNALLVEDSTNPDSSPFVIDTDGNAVFGNTTTFEIISAQTGTAAATRLQYATIAGANNSTFAIGNFSTSGTTVSPVVAFAKSKSGTIGTQAILANGDRIGLLDFQGSDGTQFVRAARIEAHVDGIPGQTAGTFTVGLSYIILSTGTTDFTLIGAASNTVGVTFTATDIGTGTGTAILATGDMPGRLSFSTTADGASSPTEHVRITSAGKTGFATTVPAATVHVAGDTILSNVNVLGATYDNVFFSVAAQEGTPQDVFFSPDGTHMYIIGSSGDDINEYELSTPWLISSAVFVTSIVVGQAETSPVGFFFRADGKKLYVIGQANDTVFQYTLSAPWNIATLSYDSVFFSVLAQESAPTSISFKPDGLSMYILGATTSDSVYQYTLSTAWDVSTAVFLQSFNVTSQETLPAGLAFTDDGTRMVVCGTTGDDVNVYNLTAPWNVSTAQFVSSLSVAGQETAPNGVYIKPDGTKMYVIGSTTDTVYQYTVPSINIQLTGQVSAGSLAVQQDLNVYGNSSSYAASFTSYTEGTFVVIGTAPKLSPTHGTIQTWTLTANSTPTAGTWANGQSLTLMIDDGTARTINWTSIGVTWKTSGGIAPLLNTTGFTVIQLWKVGDVIYGARVGDA